MTISCAYWIWNPLHWTNVFEAIFPVCAFIALYATLAELLYLNLISRIAFN